MEITIIGGGVNGICSAYYLLKEGYQVRIIDDGFEDNGTSFGNAGMIVPSHFIPLASPGVISKGVKWMFNAGSPFYIKPRIDTDLFKWLWRFYRSCNNSNVEKYQELIWNYNTLSKKEYHNIARREQFDFDFQERGLLMLYKTVKGEKEELENVKKANYLGLKTQILDEAGVQKMNKSTAVQVKGGVFYPEDAHLYSNLFMKFMKIRILELGAKIINSKVVGFNHSKGEIKEIELLNDQRIDIEQVLVCAGVWTKSLLRLCGVKMILEDGKGYSITQKNSKSKPSIPSILTEEKIAVTPMGNDLRITGTLEISDISPKINIKRVKAFLHGVPKYFPQIKTDLDLYKNDIWTGYRPLSPDGVPYVGYTRNFSNLLVATGHGMMGMSLGPATGKLVTQIISGDKPEIDTNLLDPNR